MIEIERKFRLSAEQYKAIEVLLQRDYGPLKSIRQVDEVFLQGMDSFRDFRRGMPVLRLRTVNEATQLTYKRGVNDAGDSVEHELEVGSREIMRDILVDMDCRPVVIVDKIRLQTKTSPLALMLDRVTGLGDYLEIEILATDESSLVEAERQIMAKALDFGLTENDVEPNKYDQLLASSTR
jgi:adenylate cyclase class 2